MNYFNLVIKFSVLFNYLHSLFSGCDHKDLFFAQNVTAALHVVLHSMEFEKKDQVVVTNFITGWLLATARCICCY